MSERARRLIAEVHDDWLDKIEAATDGTIVKACVLACMMPNEAGRYASGPKRGRINFDAVRFEPGVFSKLKALRDQGWYPTRKGRATSYNGVRPEDLAGAPDAALRNLASSWGGLQTMGYYTLRLFTDTDGTIVTIAELRDPDRHFKYAVQLLLSDAGARADVCALGKAIDNADGKGIRRSFERVLRRWNSGSPTGETFDPEYVDHGVDYLMTWLHEYGDEAPHQAFSVERLADAGAEAPAVESRGAGVGRDSGVEGDDTDIAVETPGTPPRASDEAAVPAAAGMGAPAVVAVTAQAAAASTTVQVTGGTRGWVRDVLGWIAGLYGLASEHVERALGLDPSIQRLLLYAVFALAVVWLLLKAVAQWQVRRIHADPALKDVA